MRATVAWLGLVAGCIGSTTDDDGQNTDETDTDTDVDADTDVDTDADADTDTSPTDTDTTPVAYEVCTSGAPFTTIQDAVDAASDGDVIDICAGEYDGVEIVGVDVDLRGEGRDATTIDGGEFYPALRVENAVVGVSAVGLTASPIEFGATGALDASKGAVVTLTDVVIRDVTGEIGTGAVRTSHTDLWFDDVMLEGNVGNGSYILEAVGGSMTMTHSVFRDNEGGLLNLVDLDVTFTNNLVYGNSTPDNVTPAVNFYDTRDTGVQLIMNNTVADNDFLLTAVAVTGSGLFSSNIVADNGGTLGIAVQVEPEYSDVWGHDQNYDPSTDPGTGSIEKPPRFADAANGDFALDPLLSPCVDAGDPDPAWNDPDGTRNDMGAFGGPDGDWTPPS
jgi:hypothetical protein